MFFYGLIITDNIASDIKAFYLIETSSVNILYGSAASTGIFLILNILLRLKKKGVLIINDDSFELIFRNNQRLLQFSSIRKIYCYDPEDTKRINRRGFRLMIDTWKNKHFVLILRNKTDIPVFLDKLLLIDQLNIDHLKWIS